MANALTAAKLGLATASGALLVSAGLALPIVANRTQPVTVDDAVASFRRSTTTTPDAAPTVELDLTAATIPTPEGTTVTSSAVERSRSTTSKRSRSTTAPTPSSVAPTTQPKRPKMPVGVYTYATRGTESVTVPGAAPHTYPDTTTVVVTHTACGASVRWAPLAQRSEQFSLCSKPSGPGLDLLRQDSHHSFVGQVDDKHLVCTPGTAFRPASDAVGFTADGRCADGAAVAVFHAKNVGVEQITVAGTAHPALHVNVAISLEGSFDGASDLDLWFAMDDDTLLKLEIETDTMTDSPVGRTRYREQVLLELQSRTPRT